MPGALVAAPLVSGYDRVKALFEAAKEPLGKEHLRSRHGGRLFALEDGVNTPIGVLLIGQDVPELPNGGPLFGKVFKMLVYLAADQTP